MKNSIWKFLDKTASVLYPVLLAVILFIFYPPYYAISDEQAYLSTAYALGKGTFFLDNAGLKNTIAAIRTENHLINKYPVGNSLLLAPFTIINWKLGFLRNYIFFFAGFLLFLKILDHYGIERKMALLYLLHPSIILYSRTLMSDIPSMFFALLGVYLILKKRYYLGGIFLGFNLLIRYTNLLIPLGICTGLLFEKRFKDVLKILPGVFLGLGLLLLYNWIAWGDIFLPFVKTGGRRFSIKYLWTSGLYYLISLNVLYPFMLVITLIQGIKRKFTGFLFTTLMFLITYSFYYYIHKGSNLIETLVMGQRFMLPVIPLMLLLYANYVDRGHSLKISLTWILPLLFILDTEMIWKHQIYLNRHRKMAETVLNKTRGSDILILSSETIELINPFISQQNWVSLNQLNNINLSHYKNIFLVIRRESDKNNFPDISRIAPVKSRLPIYMGKGIIIYKLIPPIDRKG